MSNERDDRKATPPSLSAEWNDGDGRSGVYANAEGVHWWYQPSGDGGRFAEVGCQQTFDDFVAHGAAVPGAPESFLRELHDDLETRGHGGHNRARSRPRARHRPQDAESLAYAEWLAKKAAEPDGPG